MVRPLDRGDNPTYPALSEPLSTRQFLQVTFIKNCLAGGIPTPLKTMSSSVGMMISNIWKSKKSCSKPPTS